MPRLPPVPTASIGSSSPPEAIPLRDQLDIIKDLHQALIQALDDGDVTGFTDLVQQRESALAVLRAAYASADDAERRDIRPDLVALLPLDRDLQGRATTARDDLRSQIDGQRSLAPRGAQP